MKTNPAYAPRGTISGTKGAEEFLRKQPGGFHNPMKLADIHRGALNLGAKITYSALHMTMVHMAKKEKIFYRGAARGTFGLLEWRGTSTGKSCS